MPRTPRDDTAPTEFAPQQIGRYKILKQIGEGGFGKVDLATDDQLRRQVAIKVPHRMLLESGLGSETNLDEARMVANSIIPTSLR